MRVFSGSRQVRFGANGIYTYKTLTGPVLCSDSVSGDPLFGVVKACTFFSKGFEA